MVWYGLIPAHPCSKERHIKAFSRTSVILKGMKRKICHVILQVRRTVLCMVFIKCHFVAFILLCIPFNSFGIPVCAHKIRYCNFMRLHLEM